MHGKPQQSWRLRRKLNLTAVAFALSLLLNLGVSTFAVVVYFRPAFRQAQLCFSHQQELERIRAEVRNGDFGSRPGPAGGGGATDESNELVLSRLTAVVETESLTELLGAAGEELQQAVVWAVEASTPPEPGSSVSTRFAGQDVDLLDAVDRALTRSISILGDRREEAIRLAAETQAWVVWILLANTGLGALLCLIGLESVRAWVVQPVKALQRAAERFRQGDFGARVEIVHADELGELGQELNHMAERITDLRQQLIDTERRTAAADMVRHLEQHIRPPLSQIKDLAAGSLAVEHGDEQVATCQQRIVTTIGQFEKWFGDLAQLFSRPALRLEPTTVDQIISSVLPAVQPTLEKRQVAIHVECESGMPEVRVDRLQVEQALIALLTNAAEASPPGETVVLRIRRLADRPDIWEMEVEDHGCGISKEHLDRIFLPFFTTKADGNGIGLELVREVVRLHSGRITVESQLDRGTRFRTMIPVSPPSAPSEFRMPDPTHLTSTTDPQPS